MYTFSVSSLQRLPYYLNAPGTWPPCILLTDHIVITEAANVDDRTFDVIASRRARSCRTAVLSYSDLTLNLTLDAI